MNREPAGAGADPKIRIEGRFGSADLASIAELLELLPTTAGLTVEFSRARGIELHALVRLHDLVLSHARLGRRIWVRGMTRAQGKLVELARRSRPLVALAR